MTVPNACANGHSLGHRTQSPGRLTQSGSQCMKRLGLSRLKSLELPQPVVRYERAAAGQKLQLDAKKLMHIDGISHRTTGDRRTTKRDIGWQMVHLAIDDPSPVSFAQVLPDEKADSCVQFLRQAVTYYASLGVRVERVIPTTARATRTASRLPATSSASGTSRLGRTHPRPTARPSASSRPACASGPMPSPTSAQLSARPLCSPSCATTTGIGHTPP